MVLLLHERLRGFYDSSVGAGVDAFFPEDAAADFDFTGNEDTTVDEGTTVDSPAEVPRVPRQRRPMLSASSALVSATGDDRHERISEFANREDAADASPPSRSIGRDVASGEERLE